MEYLCHSQIFPLHSTTAIVKIPVKILIFALSKEETLEYASA